MSGAPVKRKELQPGDLVFYNTRKRPYSHVGIYIGEGNFVHAPRPVPRARESIDKPLLARALQRRPPPGPADDLGTSLNYFGLCPPMA